MGWPTAQTVIAQAALEVGLIQLASDLGDNVYASSDPNIAQLRALLKKVGRDLVDDFEWQQLRAEYSFLTETVAAAVDAGHQKIPSFLLPADWRVMVEQSGWNRTNRMPMGPLSEQEWQCLSSGVTGVVWTVLFKQQQGLLSLYPSSNVPGGQAITCAYKSAYWVQDAAVFDAVPAWEERHNYKFGDLVSGGAGIGGSFGFPIYRCVQPGRSGTLNPDPAVGTPPYVPTVTGALVDGTCVWNYLGTPAEMTGGTRFIPFGTGNEPTAGPSLLMFDEQLLVAKLKLAWLDAKGFDTSSAEREAIREFGRATANNASSPILSLNGSGMVRDRLLSGLNVPITDFGS